MGANRKGRQRVDSGQQPRVPGNLRCPYSGSQEPLDQIGEKRKDNAKADRYREDGEHERGHGGRGNTLTRYAHNV